jgi:non-ribosomal peptide synthetase component F
MIEHAGAANLAQAQISAFGITSSDRVLQFASLSFDAAVSEIFITWCAGATLCLATAEQLLPGEELLSLLQTQQISTVTLPPSVLNVLPLTELPALQGLVLAGEKSSLAVVREWAQAGRRIYNAYGPTEATVCATVSEPIGAEAEEMPIGRPIANMEVYLLDGELEPVAVGVSGELYIGGAGLARAYLNRAALTAERFIPHPYSRREGARLYRTGDVARYLADGRIEYVGRSDEQVKVRGYRIELGEIEAVLGRQAGVAECVVVARGDEGEKRLVAYVVAEEGASLSVTELRAQLSAQLPSYMVPAMFVMLESLPLTKNGKVDRKALPEPEASGLERSEEYVAPRTATEEILAGIWQSVLRVERVGINDNFFELGGHSLLATQLVSRMREVFAVEIALRSLFEHPTVAGLATVLAEGGELTAPPLVPSDRTQALPLSFAQQRLWFLDQLERNNAFYNIPAAVRLSGPLNIAALERTFTEITRRHEALRTSFITVDGEARQQIIAPATFKLPLIDLTTMPVDSRSAEAERLARAEAATPFDLSAGELLRVTVLRVAAEEHMVLLTMHHIVSDGWSMGVLIKEVGTLYQAYSEGQESPLEELGIQYGDYARWQREWLQGEVLEEHLSYWREQLAELPVLELPTDHMRPAVQSYRGSHHHFTIPLEVTQQLRELSRQEGATLFMVLLAAFQLLLSRYSHQEDIVVGTIVAGRNRAETENLIGFFINQLVLRTDLSGGPTFKELVKRVREVCLGAYANQDVPFDKLVEELEPDRDPSRSPLVQVFFGLQNGPELTLELPELTLSYINPGLEAVRYDLTLWVVEENGSLSARWTYNTDLFDSSTVERMAARFEALLHSVVAKREARLMELNMQTDAEIVEETFRESEIEEASISSLIAARRRPVVLHHEASPVS